MKPAVGLIGAAMLLYMANWLAVYWFAYPFLYCWTVDGIAPVYLAFANLVNVIVICYFGYQALRGNVQGMVMSAFVVVVVVGAPVLAETAFKLGSSCG